MSARRPKTFDDGRVLAMRLVRRFERDHGDAANPYLFHAYELSASDGPLVYREGPQVDLVGEYLRRIGGASEPLRGFTSVLTDYMATGSGQDMVPTSDEYAAPARSLSDVELQCTPEKYRADGAITNDASFHASMARVLGGEPCVDFELPTVPEDHRLGPGPSKQTKPRAVTLPSAARITRPAQPDPSVECTLAVLQTLHQSLQELGLKNSMRLADQIRKEIEYRSAAREDDDDDGDRVG